MSKKSQKQFVKSNIMQKKQEIDKAMQLAELEYQNIIAEAETHIAASKKIIEDNGLVPKILFSEQELLNLLKQIYKEGADKIQLIDPRILYDIKALTEPEPESKAQEVDYEIVDEKVD